MGTLFQNLRGCPAGSSRPLDTGEDDAVAELGRLGFDLRDYFRTRAFDEFVGRLAGPIDLFRPANEPRLRFQGEPLAKVLNRISDVLRVTFAGGGVVGPFFETLSDEFCRTMIHVEVGDILLKPAAMKALERAVDLEWYTGELTDEHAESFGRFEKMEVCYSGGPQITRHFLDVLPVMPNLRTLRLARSKIGDDSAELFAKFPKLELLAILKTQFTDKGAAALCGSLSETVEAVFLPEETTTDWAVQIFKEHRPEITVERGFRW